MQLNLSIRNKFSRIKTKWVHYKSNSRFEIKEIKHLVNETFDFIKGTIHRTYKITKVLSKYGIVQKVKISFFTV